MAAGKKRALTPEEQLETALVPEDEWPYEVPDNWCWVRLGSCIGKSAEKSNTNDPNVPYVGLENIESGVGIASYADASGSKSVKSVFYPGQILYGRLRPYLNKHDVAEVEGVCSTDILVYEASERVEAQYVNLFLDTKEFIEHVVNHSKGINLPRVSPSEVEAALFPLPPLHEQRKIASRIERLFAKLDDAEAELREVVDSAKQRQVAILHKAFSGQLTEPWRREHGISQETWTEKTLGDVCSSIFDGDHMPPPKAANGIPFLVISNVNDGHLSFEDTRFVPEDYYNNLTSTRKPEIGDVLYTLVGSYGIPVMVDDERPFCFQRHMALLKPRDIEQKYLWYLLRSQSMFEKATAIATGTAQLTVPIKGLRNLEFNCPSSEERAEIIRQLDILLSKEEQTLSTVRSVLEITTLTRQAILAKALHGELGTNDPDEPSSKELLASIMSGNAGK